MGVPASSHPPSYIPICLHPSIYLLTPPLFLILPLSFLSLPCSSRLSAWFFVSLLFPHPLRRRLLNTLTSLRTYVQLTCSSSFPCLPAHPVICTTSIWSPTKGFQMPFFFFLRSGEIWDSAYRNSKMGRWEWCVMGVFYCEILKIQMKERKTV